MLKPAGRKKKPNSAGESALEAEVGIEPTNDGFANHCLTTWLLRHSHGAGASDYALETGMSMPGFVECGLQGLEGVIEFRRGAAKRGHEDDGIEDGPGEEAAFRRESADGFAGAGRMGMELDAGDESALAGFFDLRIPGFEEGKSSGEVVDFLLQGIEAFLLFENFQAGEGGGAAEGIGGVGVSVVEGVFGRAEKGVVDFAGGQGGGEGEVAAGNSFGEAEEIRDDFLVLAGEHFPGAPEAGHHLVENEMDVVCGAPSPQGCEGAGWPWAHLVDSLDEGLDDDTGD